MSYGMSNEQKEQLGRIIRMQQEKDCLPLRSINQISQCIFVLAYTNGMTDVIKVSKSGQMTIPGVDQVYEMDYKPGLANYGVDNG